ncbi:hypothetical protein CERSUDRAFT_124144 [Gelatoporia subvermispora B]|uniref:Protein kinase domain-containing protein n=1 Tax=Ceriporiopsis subvermispora (strain B) TaxID=914234 RepID=M2RFG1_CERS8|nr:hypothetical protein CERSUDRAFT_124144 [Gelatoporia subvermispora B]
MVNILWRNASGNGEAAEKADSMVAPAPMLQTPLKLSIGRAPGVVYKSRESRFTTDEDQGTWQLTRGMFSRTNSSTSLDDISLVHGMLTTALQHLCGSYVRDFTGVGWMSSESCETLPPDASMKSWIEHLAKLLILRTDEEISRESILQQWADSGRTRPRHPLRPFLEAPEPDCSRNPLLLCLHMLQDLCCALHVFPTSMFLDQHDVNMSYNEEWLPSLHNGRFVHAHMISVHSHAAAFEKFRGSGEAADEENRCREIIIWSAMQHDNIVRCFGAYHMDKYGPALIVEWMPHGTIMEYLGMNPTADRLKLIGDVAKALSYLHDTVGIAHGNPEPINILVNKQHAACLSDFSNSRLLMNPPLVEPSVRFCPSIRYAAPELLPTADNFAGSLPSRESDVYAFAMSMFEITNDHPPFPGLWDDTVALRVASGERPYPVHRPPEPPSSSLYATIRGLIQECWHQDAMSRPHIDEVQRRVALGWFYGRSKREWYQDSGSSVTECLSTLVRKQVSVKCMCSDKVQACTLREGDKPRRAAGP